jgi:hypothetical protein
MAACRRDLAKGDAGLAAHARGMALVRSGHRALAVATVRLLVAASVMRCNTTASSSLRRPWGGRRARRRGQKRTREVGRRQGRILGRGGGVGQR